MHEFLDISSYMISDTNELDRHRTPTPAVSHTSRSNHTQQEVVVVELRRVQRVDEPRARQQGPAVKHTQRCLLDDLQRTSSIHILVEGSRTQY
jgi:hypothetical protein